MVREEVELRALLERDFNSQSLQQLVRSSLGERLDHHVSLDRPFKDVVFETLMWAERTGRLPELAQAVRSSPKAPADLLAIHGAGNGKVKWTGALRPQDAHALWNARPTVQRVILDLDWDEDDALCRTLQRLLCHHIPGAFTIEVRGNIGWMNGLRRCLTSRLPTDANHEVCSGWNDVQAAGSERKPLPADGTVYDSDALAEELETGLDAWCLTKLHDGVIAALDPGAGYTGTFADIEEALGKEMKAIWKRWFHILKDNPSSCRHFLATTVSLTDATEPDWARFGVGSASVRDCLTPAVLLALAFAACRGEDALQPNDAPPGNLAASAIRGHACGVLKAQGRRVDEEITSLVEPPWQSQFVLLANFPLPPEMLPWRSHTLAEAAGPAAPLGIADCGPSLRNANLSHPVLVTGHPGIRKALREGRDALSAHLAAELTNLAARQRVGLTQALSLSSPAGESDDA